MAAAPKLTPTQQRILDLLRDGLPHTREEVHGCLDDELSQLSTIQRHISLLRAKLAPDRDILCVSSNGPLAYRMVQIISQDE